MISIYLSAEEMFSSAKYLRDICRKVTFARNPTTLCCEPIMGMYRCRLEYPLKKHGNYALLRITGKVTYYGTLCSEHVMPGALQVNIGGRVYSLANGRLVNNSSQNRITFNVEVKMGVVSGLVKIEEQYHDFHGCTMRCLAMFYVDNNRVIPRVLYINDIRDCDTGISLFDMLDLTSQERLESVRNVPLTMQYLSLATSGDSSDESIVKILCD